MEAKKLKDIESAQMVPIDNVIPHEGNVKDHPPTQVRRIVNSIVQYGWDQPIVVDGEMVIIKGHGRLLAAKELGMKEVPVVVNMDLTEEEVRMARIADNKVAESGWDVDLLWGEILTAHDKGVGYSDMGFDKNGMRRIFPDHDLLEVGIPQLEFQAKKDSYREQEDFHNDPTLPKVESFILPFRGDEAYYRKMDMVDYLNSHDKILVGFSGGKDSLGAMIWCLEHCERDKVVPYYSNLAWGPDWPHGIVFVKYLERKLGIKIFTCGSSDPGAPGRFEDLLLQHGYMESHSCWYRNYVKIQNIRAFIHQEKYHPNYGCNAVQILAVRWQESPDRALKYPDRGILKRDRIHFASPHVQWTDADLLWYLDKRGVKLHTAYQHSARMGCLVCPNESKRGCINTRKKFPHLYRLMLDWHGRGARRRGKLNKFHFLRAVSSLADLAEEDIAQLRGPYGEIALTSREFEDYVEEGLGIALPQKPYVTVPFNAEVHNFRNDLKPGAFEDPNVILDSTCELQG